MDGPGSAGTSPAELAGEAVHAGLFRELARQARLADVFPAVRRDEDQPARPRRSPIRPLDGGRQAVARYEGQVTATGAGWLVFVAAHSREHIGQASLTRQLAEQAGVDRLIG